MSERIWMVGILVLLSFISSAALSIMTGITSPIIQRNEQVSSMSTVLDVFGILYDSKDKEGIIQIYEGRIEEREAGGLTLYRDSTSGAEAVNLTGGGFQGPVSIVVALDGHTITGFKVVSQVETPGLGARITEDAFQRQFIGKDVTNGITMVKNGAGPAQFDAITGASETSRALEKILNHGLEIYFNSVGNQ